MIIGVGRRVFEESGLLSPATINYPPPQCLQLFGYQSSGSQLRSDRIKTLELIHRQREEWGVTEWYNLPPAATNFLLSSSCQKGEGGINFPRQLAPASTLNINTLFLQLAVPITTYYFALELETKETNQEKALVGAFSVTVKYSRNFVSPSFQALLCSLPPIWLSR